jgi:hypothetical protein
MQIRERTHAPEHEVGANDHAPVSMTASRALAIHKCCNVETVRERVNLDG